MENIWDRVVISDLDTSCIDTQSRPVDWSSEGWADFSDEGTWRITYPPRQCEPCAGDGPIACETCEGDGWMPCPANDNCDDCDACEEGRSDCQACDGDGHVDCEPCDSNGEDPRFEDPDFGYPMMRYAYPLASHGTYWEDEAKLITDHACLTIVEDTNQEQQYLALTGGGMDLSWSIAAAYILLGHLPPTWIRLPRMAGYGDNPEHRVVLAAMRRSFEIQRDWSSNSILELEATERWHTEYNAKREAG